ncbi:MAG: hypothetical protein ACRDHY_15230, partial [Anaerolineales bacterium]
ALMESGQVEEADRCLDLHELLATEVGQPSLRWIAIVNRAGQALRTGRIAEAEQLASAGYEIGRTGGQPDVWLYFALQQFKIAFEQGRLQEWSEDGEAGFAELARNQRSPLFHGFLAVSYCEVGRTEDARRVFDDLVPAVFDLPVEIAWVALMTDLASVCAHLGDAHWAAALSDQLAPYPNQLPTLTHGGVVGGSVAHHLGMLASTLGHYDEAEARFAAAAATHGRIGARSWLARTRLEWARMLLTRRQPGDTDRAQELLGQALATARELGLGNVERRAVELLTSR